jgi:small subunit ribosomal protein S1
MFSTETKQNQSEPFNWEVTNKFSVNKKVKARIGDKVYCHEDYASSLYALINGTDSEFLSGKDLKDGEMYTCIVTSVRENDALAQTNTGQTIYIDLKKERKDSERLNVPGAFFLPGEEIKVTVRNINGTFYGSVIECHIQNLKTEFFNQIKTESLAYEARVESVNKGGYMVDVQGIKCFLPGSLAAANKISDFDSLIGKTFYVMIDGYVAAKDIFVVSYKKYLTRIMEKKIQELDLTRKYKGHVTGTSNFGVFVEWEDIYTGLIHKTEFENQTVEGFNPGDEIEFYIKEVKEDNRLTLTFGEPVQKTLKIYEFKKAIEDGQPEVVTVSIKHKRKNGALVEMIGGGMMAFIPQEKFGKDSKNLKIGDNLEVKIYQVDPVQGKIFAEPVNE